jgi:hypothetical protein
MKSQGMRENQQAMFMSDGGKNVRRVQEYLHPFSEHLIDWFHITMRLTVLQQQTKALQEERPETGAEVSKRLGERQASAVAREHRGSPRAAGRLVNGVEFHSGPFERCEEGRRRPR